MPPLLWDLFIGSILVALLSVLSARFALFKRSYYLGISAWGSWLPVLATGFYLALLVVNVASSGDLADHTLNLGRVLSLTEMIVLLMLGPLFLTRWGNIVSTAVLVYIAQRLSLQSDDPLAATNFAASHLVLGALTVVGVLGDKMPWLKGDRVQATSHRLREILLIFVAVGALAVTATGMIKYGGFTRWFNILFGVAVPSAAMLGLLTAVFMAWLSVALGFTRHFMMPLISLPSVLVLAYLTAWPSLLIVVPFVASLALSLAIADRRAAIRPRQAGYRQTVVLNR